MTNFQGVVTFILILIILNSLFHYKQKMRVVFKTDTIYRLLVTLPILVFSHPFISLNNSFAESDACYVLVFLIIYLNYLPKKRSKKTFN